MKRPSLAGSFLKADFCWSAATSMAKPTIHTTMPTIASQPIERRSTAGDDRKCTGRGEQYPQALDCPGHEEPQRICLDLIESAVATVTPYPTEQERTESQCPQPDHHRHDHRPGVEIVAEDHRHGGDRQIGDAAGQIEVVLGLSPGRGHENDPVDDVGEQSAHREHGDRSNLAAAVASRQHHQRTDQQAEGDADN